MRAGYRVVAPDLRGYNDTDKTPPYDIDTLVADVCALITHLGERRAIIVGHDWGAGVAWHLAAHKPEFCERLVIMNCPHPVMMSKALQSSFSQIRRSWYMFFFLLPLLPERFVTSGRALMVKKTFLKSAVDRTRFDDEEIEPYREAMLKPGAAAAAIGWYRAALKQGLFNRSKMRGYPTITAPTLLIWALDDFALGYDELVPGTERYVRSLRIETIPRCGHFVQVERPEKVNPLMLAFLAENAESLHATS